MKGNLVNLFGGPACGKSTLAAHLYVKLKQQHVDVEYVNEYAKELVYEENTFGLQDQLLVVANQYHEIWAAARHNEVIITDSPVMLGPIYNPETSVHFNALVYELHSQFRTINIVLKRSAQPHSMVGRIHSLTKSISIDNRIRALLDEYGIEYVEFDPINDKIAPLVELIKQEFDI